MPSEEGNFDQLTIKFCLKYWTQQNHQKKGNPKSTLRAERREFSLPCSDSNVIHTVNGRVQLNRPVQYGGNSNITEKTVISRPCVNTWKVLCEREEMTLANPALYVWLGGQRRKSTQANPRTQLDLQWENTNRIGAR